MFDYSDDKNVQVLFGLHWHSNMEICRTVEGRCDFTIGDRTYIAEKGDIIFVNTGQLHSHNLNLGACKIEVCTFNPAILFNLSKEVGIINAHIKYSDMKSLGIADEIEQCCRYLLFEIGGSESHSPILFEANLLKILGLLLKYFSSFRNGTVDSKKVSSFQKILEFISENYADNITLQIVAKKFNYSPVHISRLSANEQGLILSTTSTISVCAKQPNLLKAVI